MQIERAFRLTSALLLLSLPLSVAHSATVEQKHLGSFSDWNAFTFQEEGKQVCYISSAAKKKEPASPVRNDVIVLVTHRPADKTFDVVSFLVGAALKKDAEPKVTFDEDRAFSLFAESGTAWAREASTDKAIVNAMRKGKSLTLKAETDKGTKTVDTYGLTGFSAAYEAINKACNVKR